MYIIAKLWRGLPTDDMMILKECPLCILGILYTFRRWPSLDLKLRYSHLIKNSLSNYSLSKAFIALSTFLMRLSLISMYVFLSASALCMFAIYLSLSKATVVFLLSALVKTMLSLFLKNSLTSLSARVHGDDRSGNGCDYECLWIVPNSEQPVILSFSLPS